MAVLSFQPAPPSASDYWSQATADYDADRYAAAASGFEHVTALLPKSGLAWAMLGLCEQQMGRHEAALRHLELAHKLGVDDASIRHVAFFHEGLLLIEKGHFEDAQSVLDRLAAEKVDTPELKAALGKAILRTRHDSPALRQAGEAEWQAANDNPQSARAYAELAGQFGSIPERAFRLWKIPALSASG